MSASMPMTPVARIVRIIALMKVPSCWLRRTPQRSARAPVTPRKRRCRRDGVFEVVAAVGDAVGPITTRLRASLGRARPRVITDPVQCLATEVQAHERHVGPQTRGRSPKDEGIERLLTRVTARSVAAVVSQRDCFG